MQALNLLVALTSQHVEEVLKIEVDVLLVGRLLSVTSTMSLTLYINIDMNNISIIQFASVWSQP